MKPRFDTLFLVFIVVLFVAFSYAVIDVSRKAYLAEEPQRLCWNQFRTKEYEC